MRKLLATIAVAALIPASAFAQTYYSPDQNGAVGSYTTAKDPSGNNRTVVLPHVVCDSGCASPVQFTPTGAAVLAVTTTTARVALPSADSTVLLTNNGAADFNFKLGGSGVTAATTDYLLPAGRSIVVAAGANTYVAAITASSSSSLAIITGTGSPTISGGGGSGGGGGGGAITAAASSYAAGAYVAGSLVDGASTTEGAKADAACGSDTGTCTWIAIAKRIAQNLTTLNSTAGNSLAAGTNVVGKFGIDQTTDGTTNAVHLVAGTALAGKFGIDQTTPGTTNGVQDASTSATGSAVPAKASYMGAVSSGNLTGLIQSDASAFLDMSTATTTQIVALSSGKVIKVTSYALHASGTTNAKFVYGTGSNCATGTTQITSNLNLTASDGMARGNGTGVLFTVPASNALCVVNSAAQVLSADVSYTQF